MVAGSDAETRVAVDDACRPARDPDELAAAVEWGLRLDGPSVIEAFIEVEPYSTTVYD